MITHVSIKTSPKIVGYVRILQIFPLTWFVIDCIHVVLEMCQGCNLPFTLRLTLGFFHCMSRFFRDIYSSILSKTLSYSYACDSSYIRHIIIILVQLFFSIFCKHKISIIKFRSIIVTSEV